MPLKTQSGCYRTKKSLCFKTYFNSVHFVDLTFRVELLISNLYTSLNIDSVSLRLSSGSVPVKELFMPDFASAESVTS